jgi:hypothetical protein
MNDEDAGYSEIEIEVDQLTLERLESAGNVRGISASEMASRI